MPGHQGPAVMPNTQLVSGLLLFDPNQLKLMNDGHVALYGFFTVLCFHFHKVIQQ